METQAYVLTTAGKPLERRHAPLRAVRDHEVAVEIEACGLCHTDLSYASGAVAPKHALPLVLGHEIVGRVVDTSAALSAMQGRRVLVPAVMPCGECPFCRAGRGNACPKQIMPGNDDDGGFATHVVVPGRPLVSLDDAPPHVDVRELSVVADAVSTAYQAIRRAEVKRGDAVFVVGAGGVGGYTTQIARALGARVVACDVDAKKLALIGEHGAERIVNVSGRAPKDVRKEVHEIARGWGIPSVAWRIFECSGTTDGQALAFALLGHAAQMVVVGFTPKSLELRLSNVMAFDATIHGSWGCPPDAYPGVLRMVYDGSVKLTPFVEHAPMSRINELLTALSEHRLEKRVVLDPRA